jgi:hypothetical protein
VSAPEEGMTAGLLAFVSGLLVLVGVPVVLVLGVPWWLYGIVAGALLLIVLGLLLLPGPDSGE